ncbi:MAG: hypothetical protein JSW06_07915 [Thermoplasmatales archaeon]|nr:MAG: hypothetical protein JSW06_07915 [Thermoplasmatales archaeon]
MTKTKSKTRSRLSPAKKAWITRKIMGGKSKYQTAKELGLSTTTVYHIAKSFPSRPYGSPGIRGGTLKLLQDIVLNGCAFYSHGDSGQKYQMLKKYFPSVCKIKMYNRTIFFLEDKKDVAARAFLENINRKIISYQELKQVTKIFDINLTRKEKLDFLGRFRSKKSLKNQRSKNNSLLKNDDSLAFFYIRKYCHNQTLIK